MAPRFDQLPMVRANGSRQGESPDYHCELVSDGVAGTGWSCGGAVGAAATPSGAKREPSSLLPGGRRGRQAGEQAAGGRRRLAPEDAGPDRRSADGRVAAQCPTPGPRRPSAVGRRR